MADQTRKISFLDVLNTVGSIASITGISLLWLKGDGGVDWVSALIIVVAVSAGLGMASALVWAYIMGYRKLAATSSVLIRVAYIGLGAPTLILLGLLLALLTNKFFLLIDWGWFFRR